MFECWLHRKKMPPLVFSFFFGSRISKLLVAQACILLIQGHILLQFSFVVTKL